MKSLQGLLLLVVIAFSGLVSAHETGAEHSHDSTAATQTAVADSTAEKNTRALESAKQVRPQMPASANLMKVTLTLCLVLGLILAIAWGFKRFGGIQAGGAHGPIKLIGQMPVGVKERIMLLEIGNEQVLVGYSASGFETLHVLQEKVDSSTASSDTQGFANVLKLAMGKNR